jgi:hypothetical protein
VIMTHGLKRNRDALTRYTLYVGEFARLASDADGGWIPLCGSEWAAYEQVR